MRRTKRKLKGLDLYVIFSISVLLIYTGIALVLSKEGITNDTLTNCIFAFFGGEIVTCALIKIFKLHKKEDYLDE